MGAPTTPLETEIDWINVVTLLDGLPHKNWISPVPTGFNTGEYHDTEKGVPEKTESGVI